MSKCVACILEGKNVRAKNSPDHTCAKKKKGYKECDAIVLHGDVLYKVPVYAAMNSGEKVSSFRARPFFVNGFKVKAHTEISVPEWHLRGINIGSGSDNFILVTDVFYKKMTFV